MKSRNNIYKDFGVKRFLRPNLEYVRGEDLEWLCDIEILIENHYIDRHLFD